MNLVKWDPFRELEDVSNRLNRIFGRTASRTESSREMLGMSDWTPSVDISETDTAYLIKGEIPGVKKEDVKVAIQDGMLTIQGERKMERRKRKARSSTVSSVPTAASCAVSVCPRMPMRTR